MVGKVLIICLGLMSFSAPADCVNHLVSPALSSDAINYWKSLDARRQITLSDHIDDLFIRGQKKRWSDIEMRRQLRFLLQNLLNGHVLPTDSANWIPVALSELINLAETDFRVRERLQIIRAFF